jgi:hypothetical protein
MSTAEKLGMGIIAVGMATALLLPGRQTPQVINAIQNLFSGSLGTAIKG